MKYFIIPVLIISLIAYLYKLIAAKRKNGMSAEGEDACVSAEKVSFSAIFQKLWDYAFWIAAGIGAIGLTIVFLLRFFGK